MLPVLFCTSKILDAADAAYTIETWSPEDECITFNCTKMRSARLKN